MCCHKPIMLHFKAKPRCLLRAHGDFYKVDSLAVMITRWRALITLFFVILSSLDVPKYRLHIDFITSHYKQINNNDTGTNDWFHGTLYCHVKLDYQTYECYQVLRLILSMEHEWMAWLGLMLLNWRSDYSFICIYTHTYTHIWHTYMYDGKGKENLMVTHLCLEYFVEKTPSKLFSSKNDVLECEVHCASFEQHIPCKYSWTGICWKVLVGLILSDQLHATAWFIWNYASQKLALAPCRKIYVCMNVFHGKGRISWGTVWHNNLFDCVLV